MGTLRRTAAAVVSTTALVGCALISGAGDLTVGPADDDGGGADTSSGADLDGASGDARSPGDSSVGPTDGAKADVTVPGKDGGDGGIRLRDVTFEDGTVLGIHGGDSMFGPTLSLATGLSALSGNDSLRVDRNTSGIQVDLAPVTELYATCLVKYENITFASTTSLSFLPESGGVLAEIRVAGDVAPLQLFVGGTMVGSAGSVKSGATLQLGVHLRQDATSSFVEVFLADKGTALGSPIIAMPVSKLGRTVGVRMGVLESGGNSKALFDDLLLDTGSLPAP